MARASHTVPVDLVEEMSRHTATVTVSVKIRRLWRVRLGIWIMRLGAWVCGMGFETELEP